MTLKKKKKWKFPPWIFALPDLHCVLSVATWDRVPGHSHEPCLCPAAPAASSCIAQLLEILLLLQGSSQMPLLPNSPIQNKPLSPVAPPALYSHLFSALSIPDTRFAVGAGHLPAVPQNALGA